MVPEVSVCGDVVFGSSREEQGGVGGTFVRDVGYYGGESEEGWEGSGCEGGEVVGLVIKGAAEPKLVWRKEAYSAAVMLAVPNWPRTKRAPSLASE
jgi:hypothetical protein